MTSPLIKLAIEILENKGKPLDKFDTNLIKFSRKKENRVIGYFMQLLSDTGEPFTLYPVSGVVAARWLSKEREADAVTLGIALVGSAALNSVIKRIVERPRPRFKIHLSKSSGSSFPSSHMTMSLATYGAMAYLMARGRKRGEGNPVDGDAIKQLWTPALFLCALIGWSRVYQGVHHPSDVLGGIATGGAWLAASGVARRFMER